MIQSPPYTESYYKLSVKSPYKPKVGEPVWYFPACVKGERGYLGIVTSNIFNLNEIMCVDLEHMEADYYIKNNRKTVKAAALFALMPLELIDILRDEVDSSDYQIFENNQR
jgi:hypothetical protein